MSHQEPPPVRLRVDARIVLQGSQQSIFGPRFASRADQDADPGVVALIRGEPIERDLRLARPRTVRFGRSDLEHAIANADQNPHAGTMRIRRRRLWSLGTRYSPREGCDAS